MITELLASYDHTLGLIRRTVADLRPEDMTAMPTNVPNHPAWTIGHLVHSAEAIGREIGPLPDERHRSTSPTLAHAVFHVLAAHTAFHAGQLTVWRRAMNLSTEAAL